MPKKKKKFYVGTDLRRPKHPNRSINSPVTGTAKFADFPEVSAPGKSFQAGPIYLREGQHVGPHAGFGFQHIWQEHFQHVQDPAAAEQQVAAFVAAILTAGSSIFYEGGLGKLHERATVLRNAAGVVILEERTDGLNNVIYAVVTAIPRGNAHGTLIGQLGTQTDCA